MDRIRKIIDDDNSNIRVYLLKKNGYKGKYESVLFPNALDQKIRETYAINFEHFSAERKIVEYDRVHSEKRTIKKLHLDNLSSWANVIDAISTADKNKIILNKQNFTDDYSAIVLLYEKNEKEKAYLIAKYRKIESWYKRSIKFGFVANTVKQKDDEIFVLNGCIDAAIIDDEVFVFQETSFENIFNYYENSKKIVFDKKDEIKNWTFLNDPEAFYENVVGKKGATIKLARALEKAVGDFPFLEPKSVKLTLSQYDEFKDLSYDENDRIIFEPAVRDLIIDLLRRTYTRDLFSDNLVHTKGG